MPKKIIILKEYDELERAKREAQRFAPYSAPAKKPVSIKKPTTTKPTKATSKRGAHTRAFEHKKSTARPKQTWAERKEYLDSLKNKKR